MLQYRGEFYPHLYHGLLCNMLCSKAFHGQKWNTLDTGSQAFIIDLIKILSLTVQIISPVSVMHTHNSILY